MSRHRSANDYDDGLQLPEQRFDPISGRWRNVYPPGWRIRSHARPDAEAQRITAATIIVVMTLCALIAVLANLK